MNGIKSLFTTFRKSRTYKVISIFIYVSLSIIVALFFYPDPLFPYRLEYKNYTIRSRQPIDTSIRLVLDKTTKRLTRSEINKPDLKHEIYLLESFTAAKFWGFRSIGAIGWNTMISEDIFIVKTDIPKDLCYRDSDYHNQRGLSEILSHEITHSLQFEDIGFLRYRTLPLWISEGYPEYICTDFELKDAQKKLAEVKGITDPAADYVRYRMAVSYLMIYKKFTWKTLMETNLALKDVLSEIENK